MVLVWPNLPLRLSTLCCELQVSSQFWKQVTSPSSIRSTHRETLRNQECVNVALQNVQQKISPSGPAWNAQAHQSPAWWGRWLCFPCHCLKTLVSALTATRVSRLKQVTGSFPFYISPCKHLPTSQLQFCNEKGNMLMCFVFKWLQCSCRNGSAWSLLTDGFFQVHRKTSFPPSVLSQASHEQWGGLSYLCSLHCWPLKLSKWSWKFHWGKK